MILFCSSLILSTLFAILLVLFLVLPMGTYKPKTMRDPADWHTVKITRTKFQPICIRYQNQNGEWVPFDFHMTMKYKLKNNKFVLEDTDRYDAYRTSPFAIKFYGKKFICRSKIVWFSISLFGLSAGIFGSIFFGIKVKHAKAVQQQKDD